MSFPFRPYRLLGFQVKFLETIGCHTRTARTYLPRPRLIDQGRGPPELSK